jgi:hypothetical protein
VKKILIPLLMFLLLSFIAYGVSLTSGTSTNIIADKDIRISMVNQEPDPVEPGKYVTVKFKASNYGSYDTNDIVVGIEASYPFTLMEGQSLEQNIGPLRKRQMGNDVQIFEWKLMVDKDAAEGLNNITLYYKEESTQASIVYKDVFSVEVRTSDAVISIESIETKPEHVTPGAESVLKIKLKNLADSFLKDITVSLNLDSANIATIGSTNKQIVQKLDAKEEIELSYNIIPDSTAEVKTHKIPLNIQFKDNINNAYTLNTSFGLKVESPVEYMVSIDASDIISTGKKGEVTVKISNKGVNNIKFLTAELKPSSQYEIISAPKVYIGKIDSDDYETASYDIYAKEADKNDVVTLRLLLQYRDNYNQEFSAEEEVPLQLFSDEKAKQYGLVQKSSGSGLIILLLIVAAVIGYILYRRKKKKEQEDK